jgi:hypothetical protein
MVLPIVTAVLAAQENNITLMVTITIGAVAVAVLRIAQMPETVALAAVAVAEHTLAALEEPGEAPQ